MNRHSKRAIILKFGGAGLASRKQWDVMAKVVSERLDEGLRPLVICSALTDVTNNLQLLLEEAATGDYAQRLDEIRFRHEALADALGIDAESALELAFEDLERLVSGVSLIRKVTPALTAEVLAHGELFSTRLASAFLREQDIKQHWLDAREVLVATESPQEHEVRRYLAATCEFAPNEALQAKLAGFDADAVVTQGFIARNRRDETVLVGREGSDTSAAYFAAMVEAERVEIWTDVPGLFSANPHLIPSARLLLRLDYDEAQEMAVTGAKVLHPDALEPVRRYNIPLHIHGIGHPDLEGTAISGDTPDATPHVKAVSAKSGVILIEMRAPDAWKSTGFMEKVFSAFRRHGLAADLVATSKTDVTVSLDRAANALDPAVIDDLLADLNAHCAARAIGPCAAISLVGRGIRSILHRLTSAFELFEEQRIYLVSQAANDLNFTVVVDEEQADRLTRSLHAELFATGASDPLLGPSWDALTRTAPVGTTKARPPTWWRERRDDLLSLAENSSPAYVYDEATLRETVERLQSVSAVNRAYYSIKANSHPDILRLFAAAGLGLECVSIDELQHIRSSLPDFPPERILFTPNFAPREEYSAAIEAGVLFTLDNIYPLQAWPEVFRGQDFLLRVDPGYGRGHHKHVRTAGSRSKFGIPLSAMGEARSLTEHIGSRVVGLHAHSGSNIFDAEHWLDVAELLAEEAQRFPEATILNVGGGLGVAEQSDGQSLNLAEVGEALSAFKKEHPGIKLWIEPGRFLVPESGVLLARVTQLKQKSEDHHYVGLETGMNSLIRPALYGSYHEIVNLTRLNEPLEITASIVGPICETGDVLGHDRRLPRTEEGDVMLVSTVGAYGHAMSSSYNRRGPAEEQILR